MFHKWSFYTDVIIIIINIIFDAIQFQYVP